MVQINFALREVNCKIVYYGPGLSGKTTNLEVVHSKAPDSHVGELTSIATEGDRTLFFDFLPLNLGQVSGMTTKFQLYTVPGQVYYNSTRKLVLQGADGIVFVADSRRGKMDENLESLQNLEENLHEYGMDIHTIPLVLQYNKRDLPEVYPVEELEAKLNGSKVPSFEAVAVTGEGVFPTLKKLSSMVLESLNRQQGSTVVRAPRAGRRGASAKQPVAVGAGATARSQGGGGGRGAATATTTPRTAGRPGRGQPAGASRPPAGRHEGQGRGGGRVVRERVARSPDVKPIERSTVQRGSAAGRSPRRGVAPAPPPRKKSKAGIVVGLILLTLAAAGAGLYFSGMLDSVLK